MTRNPFERYLSVGQAKGVNGALHARLSLAIGRRGVVQGLESLLRDGDDEMVDEVNSMDVEE